MDEIVFEFVNETLEGLDAFEEAVFALEGEEAPSSHVDGMFRSMHTIKGSCGFLGFARLEALAHQGENLLVELREGRRAVDAEIIAGLLRLSAAIREILQAIESGGTDANAEVDRVVELLESLREGPVATPKASTPESRTTSTGRKDRSVRVPVEVLDNLMNLVGELVLTRNRLIQAGEGDRSDPLRRLDHLITELQGRVMRTRMQPVRGLWRAMRRVVHEVADSCGKRIDLTLEGEQTELDKSLLEAVKDPLTHLLRNAIDHGIENVKARKALGKPLQGQVRLRAYHEGGLVNLEIADDGAGIDTASLRRKAIQLSILSEAEASVLGEQDALDLIFQPGLSTAEYVSETSGRGVGMDVVRTNIQALGGAVEIDSRLGVGTTFRIQIPLTLAIVPAQIVGVGGLPFAIPQVNLVELMSMRDENRIQQIHESRVLRRDGVLVPCLDLRELLALPVENATPERTNLVLMQAGSHLVAVIVDQIHDTQEIVVKALPDELAHVPSFAGATILGDGSIALILDALQLAKRCQLDDDERVRAANSAQNVMIVEAAPLSVLLRGEEGDLRVVALKEIARVERFDAGEIAWTGGGPVLPCVNGFLMLRSLDDLEPAHWIRETEGRLGALVVEIDDETVGLCFRGQADIIQEHLDIGGETRGSWRLGSAVTSAGVADVVDVASMRAELGRKREVVGA